MMNKHCKGCSFHHSTGRRNPKDKGLKKFNDWCCAKGAKVDVGWCKTHNAKKKAEWEKEFVGKHGLQGIIVYSEFKRGVK